MIDDHKSCYARPWQLSYLCPLPWTPTPVQAREYYAQLVHRCQEQIGTDRVKDGLFGAMMDVNLINDGPVTISLDSQARN